jgi:hypothetical protein
MANLRAPLLASTTAVVSPDAAINAEEVIAIEKSGDLKILFVFDYDHTERNIEWEYATNGDRDTEYALLVVDSTQFKAGNDAVFVTSAAATITDRTGVATVSEQGLNLNKVASVSKDAAVTYLGTGSTDIYKLKFTYKAIDGFKEVTWNYAASVDRDNTYTEVIALAAALQYIP